MYRLDWCDAMIGHTSNNQIKTGLSEVLHIHYELRYPLTVSFKIGYFAPEKSFFSQELDKWNNHWVENTSGLITDILFSFRKSRWVKILMIYGSKWSTGKRRKPSKAGRFPRRNGILKSNCLIVESMWMKERTLMKQCWYQCTIVCIISWWLCLSVDWCVWFFSRI